MSKARLKNMVESKQIMGCHQVLIGISPTKLVNSSVIFSFIHNKQIVPTSCKKYANGV